MTSEELDALTGALGQRAAARETGGIAEGDGGFGRIGARAVRARLESRRVSLLRADGPLPVAVIAERECDPILVWSGLQGQLAGPA